MCAGMAVEDSPFAERKGLGGCWLVYWGGSCHFRPGNWAKFGVFGVDFGVVFDCEAAM